MERSFGTSWADRQKRVVWTEKPELDVGVFKRTKSAKPAAERTADAAPADAVLPPAADTDHLNRPPPRA